MEARLLLCRHRYVHCAITVGAHINSADRLCAAGYSYELFYWRQLIEWREQAFGYAIRCKDQITLRRLSGAANVKVIDTRHEARSPKATV